MRVLRLQAENFKRLTAIDITPTGDVVTITGKNAQGKSSVLDALWATLAGAGAMPREAIRQGTDRALLRVDLGKYIVTRTISKKKDGGETTSVKVSNADGAVFPSPQKLLDDLIGELSFDPLEFSRGTSKEQFDALAKFAPGVDFQLIANQNRGDYDKRTDVNRRAKEARAAAGIISVPSEIPEKVDEAALVAQLGSATKREAEISAHGRTREALEKRIEDARKSNEVLEARAVALRRELDQINVQAGEAVELAEQLLGQVRDFPPAPERIDTAAVAEQLQRAQVNNRAVDDILARVKKRASMNRLAESLEKEADELTARMDARNAAKAQAISEAKLPVAGLGFGDGEVLLNGVPFAQGSSAEQLRTSVAIAAAMNPELRVIHIRDGSLLDADSMAWVAEYAKANDLQCWVEVVGTDPTVGVLIEDGHVKADEVAA